MKILCKLPHASSCINGIAFEPCDGGMVSVDEVPSATAGLFLSINGYFAVDAGVTDAGESEAAAATQRPRKRKNAVEA